MLTRQRKVPGWVIVTILVVAAGAWVWWELPRAITDMSKAMFNTIDDQGRARSGFDDPAWYGDRRHRVANDLGDTMTFVRGEVLDSVFGRLRMLQDKHAAPKLLNEPPDDEPPGWTELHGKVLPYVDLIISTDVEPTAQLNIHSFGALGTPVLADGRWSFYFMDSYGVRMSGNEEWSEAFAQFVGPHSGKFTFDPMQGTFAIVLLKGR